MRRIAPLFIALGLVAAACSSDSADEPVPDPEAPTTTRAEEPDAGASFAGTTTAPEFPAGLDWLNTEVPLTLEQLRGKIVVLDFWTYGCINCIHIIPDLERLEEEYADELVVIGVHSAKFDQEGATANIRQVVLRYELQHPVVNDRDFEVWRTWGANAWPTTVLIDPLGNIVGGHSGEGVYGVMRPVIESLVSEFDASGDIDRTPLAIRLERDGLPETILSFPGKVEVDIARDRLFIADTNHHRIVVTDLEGSVIAVYGDGTAGLRNGVGLGARFQAPQGLELTPDGTTLFVADTDNHAVRRVDVTTGAVTTLVGDGAPASWPPRGGLFATTRLSSPWDLQLAGETLYVAMAGTHQIWTLDLNAESAEVLAGNARESTRNGPRLEAELAQPSGLSLGDDGRLFFADSESSAIRWVDVGGDGRVDILAGSDQNLFDFGDTDGVGTAARLQHPLGVSFVDGTLYVTDTYNSKIKAIDPATGATATYLGGEAGWRDGPAALFYEPGGIDAGGGRLWVADTNNHAIRVVDLATGDVDTLLITGIERFLPSADDAAFGGVTIVTEPARVQPGPTTVVLDVTLPPRHKVNEEAPSAITWSSTESLGEEVSLTGTIFPVTMEVHVDTDTSVLRGDLNLIWCAADAQTLCFIEQVRFEVPVQVAPDGDTEILLEHSVAFPTGS